MVRYFLEVGSSQLTPTQVILAGVGVGVVLLSAIVLTVWILRRVRASAGAVDPRVWSWLLSAALTWVGPVVVLGRWMSLQDEDVDGVAQFALVLLLVTGFILANVVTHVSNPDDESEDTAPEISIESDELVPPGVLGPSARIVAAGDRHNFLVLVGSPVLSGGFCLVLAYLLELLPSK